MCALIIKDDSIFGFTAVIADISVLSVSINFGRFIAHSVVNANEGFGNNPTKSNSESSAFVVDSTTGKRFVRSCLPLAISVVYHEEHMFVPKGGV